MRQENSYSKPTLGNFYKEAWLSRGVNKLIGSGVLFAGLLFACVTTVADPELYFVHNDHLNTPQMLTDQNGQVVWKVESQTPFGVVVVNEDVDQDGQAIEFNIRFPGQYYDSETGLSYNYYRDYDPLLGRYVQSDPIGLEGGINTYGYALNNPLRYIDPYGLSSCPPATFASCQQKCASLGLTVQSCSSTNILVAEVWTCDCDEDCPLDSYENPGHHDPTNTGPNPYDRSKSTLPKNHEELWKNSRKGPDNNRWAKEGTGKKAEYHRFQNDGNGNWHWNGSTNGTTSNGSPRPISSNNVPNEVKKW